MIAIDHGGLCLREQKPDGGFMLTNNHVAVLEAKPHFQCLENGRPVISDGNLAQMICQALATRCSFLNILSHKGKPITQILLILPQSIYTYRGS